MPENIEHSFAADDDPMRPAEPPGAAGSSACPPGSCPESRDGETADTRSELQHGPEMHVYHYPPAVPCAACGGRGSILLLVNARPCEACEGSGWVWPEPRHEHTPPRLGYWRRRQTFDDRGWLIREQQWFEPAEDADGAGK